MEKRAEQIYYVPAPPPFIFLNEEPETIEGFSSNPDQVVKENRRNFVVDKVDVTERIKVFYKDAEGKPLPYPKKGFPFPEAVASVNKTKRFIMEILSLSNKKQFYLSWLIILFSSARTKIINDLIELFIHAMYDALRPYFVKPEMMTEFASEFQGLIHGFLMNMGIKTKTSRKFAQIIGSLFEYDMAYRLRLEDLFSETTQEKLEKNPRKETKRLFKIYLERERLSMVKPKFVKAFRITNIALMIPTVQKAVSKATRRTDFQNLQLDEIDKYWCKLRSDDDYYYQGMTQEKRKNGYIIPPLMQIEIDEKS